MAKVYGKTSDYLIRQDRISRIFSVLYLLILGFVAWAILMNINAFTSAGGLLFSFFIFTPFIWFTYRQYKNQKINSDKFKKGIQGEEDIAAELSKLTDDYSVFQGIKIVTGDIDFVVVGPTGVFMIEAKSHSGEINFDRGNLLRNGELFEKDILRQCKREVIRLNQLLRARTDMDYSIMPVIAFSNPYARLKLKEKSADDVYIVNKSSLNKIITENKTVLSEEELTKADEALLYEMGKQ